MRAIFISYRREDSEGQAGRLFDDLVRHFGNDSVFMDVTGIEAGRDFRRAIDEHVASCGVLLAVIGKNWLEAKDDSGQRRLDNPMDFVRLETASALKRDIPVVPVLVAGACMPRVNDLPEDLEELVYRNGVELTHARWDSDVEVLVKALSPYVHVNEEATSPTTPAVRPAPRTSPMWIVIPVLAVLLVLALAFVGYLVFRSSSQDTVVEVPTPAPTPSNTNLVSQDTITAGPQPKETPTERALSFEDWQGRWDVSVDLKGKWFGPFEMELKSNQAGIEGTINLAFEGEDEQLHTLSATFVNGDFSEVRGEDTTDTSCTGDKPSRFTLKLKKDGRNMEGVWGLCNEDDQGTISKATKH